MAISIFYIQSVEPRDLKQHVCCIFNVAYLATLRGRALGEQFQFVGRE